MKAVQLVRTGAGIDGLDVRDIAEPEPAADEVLVAVRAVSASRLELEQTMAGVGLGKAVTLPRTLGMDPTGVVVSQGAAVMGDLVGSRVAVKPNLVCGACSYCESGHEADCTAQRVLGVHRDGGAGEFVAVPALNVFTLADSVDFADAAATVHSAAVARHMLGAADPDPARVLVLGASGAVGSAAVQLAARGGAHVVGCVSSESKAELALLDGAHTTVSAADLDLVEPVDVVIDTTGDADLLSAAVDRLAWKGTAVTCAARPGRPLRVDGAALYRGRRSVRGVAGSDFGDVRAVLADLAAGMVRPRIAAKVALADAASGYAALADRGVSGKVVLVMDF